MDNTSPDSGKPRKNRSRHNDMVVDLVLDNTNSVLGKPPYPPRSPAHQKLLEEARDRYLAWKAEQEEIDRRADADAAKPQDPSDDSSASGPTSGS